MRKVENRKPKIETHRRAAGFSPRGRSRLVVLTAAMLCCSVAPAAWADGDDPKAPEDDLAALTEKLKPTPVGVRFTPAMARAMSTRFAERMTKEYDLDDGQTQEVRGILTRRLMHVFTENAEVGRDMIELMMANMIGNDGQFTKADARQFAKASAKLLPNIKTFFAKTSAEIGQKMTLKQRLKLTGEMAKATAGLLIFETRMKKWESGDIPDLVSFFDSDEEVETTQTGADGAAEHPDHRRARRRAERRIEWEVEIDRRWEDYVEKAIAYYGLDESQTTAARAVLDDCRKRAKAVKTPKWREAIKETMIARQLVRRIQEQWNHQDPWTFKLETQYERLRQPLRDLDKELKQRIDALADSTQRAAAEEAVRRQMAEHGLKTPPV